MSTPQAGDLSVRPRIAQKHRAHRGRPPPDCGLCFQVCCGQAATGRLADAWPSDRSARLWSGASNACRTRSSRAHIWDFIEADSLAEADRWVDKLDEKFNLVASQPLMGRTRGELSTSLRSFPFGRYMISYIPIEDGIDIVRVLHGARDIDAVFGEGD